MESSNENVCKMYEKRTRLPLNLVLDPVVPLMSFVFSSASIACFITSNLRDDLMIFNPNHDLPPKPNLVIWCLNLSKRFYFPYPN